MGFNTNTKDLKKKNRDVQKTGSQRIPYYKVKRKNNRVVVLPNLEMKDGRDWERYPIQKVVRYQLVLQGQGDKKIYRDTAPMDYNSEQKDELKSIAWILKKKFEKSKNSDLKELWRKFLPKNEYYAIVFDADDIQAGPQKLRVPSSVAKVIFSEVEDIDDISEVFGPDGRIVTFSHNGAEGLLREYVKIKLTDEKANIVEDGHYTLEELEDNVPDVLTTTQPDFKPEIYEKVKAKLLKLLKLNKVDIDEVMEELEKEKSSDVSYSSEEEDGDIEESSSKTGKGKGKGRQEEEDDSEDDDVEEEQEERKPNKQSSSKKQRSYELEEDDAEEEQEERKPNKPSSNKSNKPSKRQQEEDDDVDFDGEEDDGEEDKKPNKPSSGKSGKSSSSKRQQEEDDLDDSSDDIEEDDQEERRASKPSSSKDKGKTSSSKKRQQEEEEEVDDDDFVLDED